jgi:4-methyl-5(b-hydroxyethyl)-thiazole monophosphate biosynthesis
MTTFAPKKVLLLLCQGTETLEASAFIDVMGWANDAGSTPISVVTTALSPSVVTCTFGVRLIADRSVSEISACEFDALAIPGGFQPFGFYDDAYSPIVQNLIRQFGELRKPIGAICVGALPLAKTGLLSGRRATTYHLGEGRRRRQLSEFGALVVDEHVVQDGQFITSSSPATAVEVALRLLAAITNEANAQHIRYLMGFSNAPAG